MSKARRLLTWSLLAVHLSVSLFGELVHLVQCASCAVDATDNAVGGTCSCHGHFHHSHRANAGQLVASANCASRAQADGRASKPAVPQDRPAPCHDSQSCAVCQVLAIAKDVSVSVPDVVGIDCLPQALIPIRESVVGSEFRDAQSRGPPLV